LDPDNDKRRGNFLRGVRLEFQKKYRSGGKGAVRAAELFSDINLLISASASSIPLYNI
jgi:hypothetical protein